MCVVQDPHPSSKCTKGGRAWVVVGSEKGRKVSRFLLWQVKPDPVLVADMGRTWKLGPKLPVFAFAPRFTRDVNAGKEKEYRSKPQVYRCCLAPLFLDCWGISFDVVAINFTTSAIYIAPVSYHPTLQTIRTIFCASVGKVNAKGRNRNHP